MKTRAKQVPRLWCALQGLLPFEACLAAQRGELAWPPEPAPDGSPGAKKSTRSRPGPVHSARELGRPVR